MAHADWGLHPRKQWVAIARRDARRRWTAFAPLRVADSGSLRSRLHADGDRETAILGFDFPVGVPRAYATSAGVTDFRELLGVAGGEGWSEFFNVADDLCEIEVTRPFYPRTFLPKGSKKRAHLVQGLGLDFLDLLRRCERKQPSRPAACPLFWTLGGQAVGKGALAGWQLLQSEPPETMLWPFDGEFEGLVAAAPTIVAETYPAEFYRHLGLGRVSGKRKQGVRMTHARSLVTFARELDVTLEAALERRIYDGFGSGSSGEDEFDAVVGMLGMLNVITGRRGSGAPHDDLAVRSVEGWMLGQEPIADASGN